MRVFRMLILLVAIGSFVFGCGPKESTSVEAAKTSPAKAKPAQVKPADKADKSSVARAWDFAKLSNTKWQWSFPKGYRATPQGAVFNTHVSIPGAKIQGLNLKSADVKGVRVEVSAVKILNGKRTPQPMSGVRIRWVRKDVDGAKPGDFDSGFVPKVRLKEFSVADKAQPNVWVGTVAGDPNWNGVIEKARVDVCFAKPLAKPATDGVYEVTVKSIEFLK